MREKSENEARDRYARQYAAVLTVEAIIQFRAKTEHVILTVEAEDKPEWDDIVLVGKMKNVSHRHQVKKQQTPLAADDFGKYVKAAAAGNASVQYHFAFPTMIEVKDVDHTRILRTLCGRLRQDGANHAKVLEGLREGEKKWLEAVKKWAAVDDAGAMKLLTRIHLDAIGFEEDLDNRALRLLEPIFGTATEEAWKRLKAFVADKEGVVEIEPEALIKTLPPPAADEIETFYWSFVEEVEAKFEVNSWTWLTDHAVRNLIPEEFHDNVYDYSLSVQRAIWPDRYPELNEAFKDLAKYAV